MTQSGGNFLDDLLLGVKTVQSNGAVLPTEPTINFIGAVVTDDPGNSRTNIALSADPNAVSGTGFWHSTSGVLDTAARAVNLSTDTTGVLPLTDLAQNGASTNQAMIWTGTQWAPGNTAVLPINLAGGSADVIGVLPAANQAAQTMGGDVTGTTAANVVTTITGTAGVVTVAAGTLKETGTTLSIADSGGVVRDSFDMTHGRITAGGGGTDYSATIGPMPTLESSFAAFYLLPNGTSPNTSNWLIDYNGSSPHFNSPNSGAPILFYDTGTTLLLSIASSGITVGRSVMQWDSSLSTATLGTNRAGATLALQADAAITIQTLASTGTELANLSTPAAGTGPRLVGASGRFEVVDSDGTVRIF